MNTGVYAYEKEILLLNIVPIVSGGSSWEYLVTGQTYIIIINEALYHETKLDHSLFNSNHQ